MKLACLFGHKWNGCTCVRCGKVQDRDDAHRWNGCTCEICGKVRNEEHLYADFKAQNGKCVGRCKCGNTQALEHDWKPVPGKCIKVCSRCGTEQSYLEAEHTWQRVPGTCTMRCSVCGKELDIDWEAHDWKRLDGECVMKCSVCGRERSIEHSWAIVEGFCKEKCTVCGTEREKHNYVNGRCSRCGKQDPEAFMDECVEKLLQIFPVTWLDSEGHARFDAAHRDEVRKIGEQLDKLGGMQAMQRVGEEFARRRPIHARKLETTWDGIGYWLG